MIYLHVLSFKIILDQLSVPGNRKHYLTSIKVIYCKLIFFYILLLVLVSLVITLYSTEIGSSALISFAQIRSICFYGLPIKCPSKCLLIIVIASNSTTSSNSTFQISSTCVKQLPLRCPEKFLPHTLNLHPLVSDDRPYLYHL